MKEFYYYCQISGGKPSKMIDDANLMLVNSLFTGIKIAMAKSSTEQAIRPLLEQAKLLLESDDIDGLNILSSLLEKLPHDETGSAFFCAQALSAALFLAATYLHTSRYNLGCNLKHSLLLLIKGL